MPKGQPLSCPEPSGSPLLNSWTPPSSHSDTPTTTTQSPDAIVIPTSGNGLVCRSVDVPIEQFDDCVPFSVSNTGVAPRASLGVVSYLDCYTNEVTAIVLRPGDCNTIYSRVQPTVISTGESGGGDDGGGGTDPSDPNNPNNIIIEPLTTCEVPPTNPPIDPDDPYPENPDDPENPNDPPDGPVDEPNPIPSGDPIPPGDPEDPDWNGEVPTDSGIPVPPQMLDGTLFRIVTQGAPLGLAVPPTVELEQNRRGKVTIPFTKCYQTPLVYIDGATIRLQGRRDTKHILPKGGNLPYTNGNESEWEENRLIMNNTDGVNMDFEDKYNQYFTSSTAPNVTINYNNQDFSYKGKSSANLPNVMARVVESGVKKCYLIPPLLDTSVPSPKELVTEQNGFQYFQHIGSGVTINGDAEDFREEIFSPLNKTSMVDNMDRWKTRKTVMTKGLGGRLLSNQSRNYDPSTGLILEDTNVPQAYVDIGVYKSGKVRVPLAWSYLWEYETIQNVAWTRDFLSVPSQNFDVNLFDFSMQRGVGLYPQRVDSLVNQGLVNLCLNTYSCSYISQTSTLGYFPRNCGVLNGADGIGTAIAYTDDIYYNGLKVPTRKAEHFYNSFGILAVMSDGTCWDVSDYLIAEDPALTFKNLNRLKGTYYTGNENDFAASYSFEDQDVAIGTFRRAEGYRLLMEAKSFIGREIPEEDRYENTFGYTKEDFAAQAEASVEQVRSWETKIQFAIPAEGTGTPPSGIPTIPEGVDRRSTADHLREIANNDT